ncbi:S-adenosyl-L-methionine-dependent methyltransferase [Aspergillus bertholletiae]|uniref:S-adenosyl-L-methionine-dependent methyltransferase n=1 Tax=Aspergillus bertholletiae TaxID=1226010 RepID=A0A5N7AWG2_9EURO|nr:S-adenosyl-L-methionine-dependent methyltransferase [Aspergillus bertholletiae]
MPADAETVFNSLGARYEAAFGMDRELQRFIELAAKVLPSRSRVLDVGCGTGKPVSHTLASAGHEVHGIDISQEMVTIAGLQVAGDFQVADMRTYQPSELFDAVFAILSLFQMPSSDVCSIVVRFSQWIKVGGYLVLGVTPSTALDPEKVTYDSTWDCALMLDKPWMGNLIDDSFLSEERWSQLLRESGFAIEIQPVSYLFSPSGPDHSPEAHYLLMAKKIEQEPLLGPYPLPRCLKPSILSRTGDLLTHNLVSKDLERLLEAIEDSEKVLCIGKDLIGGRFQRHKSRFLNTPLEDSLFLPGTFSTVLALWQLDNLLDMERAIQQMTRLVSGLDSKIVVVQGGPYNEVVQLLTSVTRSAPVGHQGHLLHSAIQYLAKYGFGDINLHRIDAHYEFQEENCLERCTTAADFLTGIWHKQHFQHELIKKALIPRLQLRFRSDANMVSHGMVAIVARPFPNQGKST